MKLSRTSVSSITLLLFLLGCGDADCFASALVPFTTPIISRKDLCTGFICGRRSDKITTLSMDVQMSELPKELPTLTKTSNGQTTPVRYSDFLKLVRANKIESVTLTSAGDALMGIDTEGTRLKLGALPDDPDLLTELTDHKVDIKVLPATSENGGLGDLAQSLIVPAVLFAGLFFLSRNRANFGDNMPNGFGGNNPMSFGKANAKIELVPDTGVTFDDVAGCDGAKLELEEVVDFLKQPETYTKMGCKLPRGVMLDGPPGTGKTLLAKAVAGEAGVPFISIAGSEFVEMYVGVGASRVRDVFDQAKKNAPCIVFIDEIDAVGRQRGAGYAGGNDEREQTVNQILVEMDGFEGNPGIMVIAATNRIDILDSALLRPGRFDRKVTVDLPDYKGRTEILRVHSRGKPLEPDIDLEAVARRTPGFSGAQLMNLMNEAAINAARRDSPTLGWDDIDRAADRIMIGLEKQGGWTIPEVKELVAYHEAGHAVVGALVPDYDNIQKVSIVPRSDGAGGVTFFSPQESRLESGMYSRQYLESQLAVALGGRLAEEIVYGEDRSTTGASNDIQQVASIANSMVREYGMSEKIGPIAISQPSDRNPFMGLEWMGQRRSLEWGEEISKVANEEVERLVDNAYLLAKKILTDNRDLFEHLAKTLIDQEQVSAEEFQLMLIQFNAKSIQYKVLGDAVDNREFKLPYSEFSQAI